MVIMKLSARSNQELLSFGFWCQEDLHKAGRMQSVAILPLGIRYYFVKAPWQSLAELLAKLEVDSGLTQQLADDLGLVNGQSPNPEQEEALYQRLYQLGEYLLSVMEEFYGKFYQQTINPEQTELAHRLPALLNSALNVAEQAFEIKPNGKISDRCRRVEQAAWERIYRQDIDELETLAPAKKRFS